MVSQFSIVLYATVGCTHYFVLYAVVAAPAHTTGEPGLVGKHFQYMA